jgi:hypothetical protein
VAASINNGDTITYQWQYYGYDPNTYEASWFDAPSQTSSSFAISPNTLSSMGLNIDYYQTPQFRCVLTGVNSPTSQTTTVANWTRFDQVGAYADFFGYNGTYPDGYVTVNGKGYTTLTLASGEDLAGYFYDMGYPSDSSWYSSNAFTTKIQVSDDAVTWSDISSTNFRSGGFYGNIQATASSGVKYYRFLLQYNWPFTTTNGTLSSRTAPESVQMTGVRVTWPAAGVTVLSGSASGSGTNTITATAQGNISLSVPDTRTLTWTGAPGQYITGPQQAGFSYDSEIPGWYRNFIGSSFTVIAGTYTTDNTQNGATLTFTP